MASNKTGKAFKLSRLLIILTIPCLFLLGVLPRAACQQCADLFRSGDHRILLKTSEHPARLRGLADSIREQRRNRVKLEEIQIPVTAEVLETIDWMRNQLSELIMRNEIEFSNAALKSQYERYVENLSQMAKKAHIGYVDFVFQAQRFSIMVERQKKLLVGLRDSQKRATLEAIEDYLKADSANRMLADLISRLEWADFHQSFVLFPTFRELDIRTMNRAHAEGIGYLGLTTVPLNADKNTYLPHGFFLHDFGHSIGFEAYTAAHLPFFPKVKALTLDQRRAIFGKFEDWLARNRLSESDIELYQILWFIEFHEYSKVLHPEILLYSFQREAADFNLQGVDIIGDSLRRLNHPNDLNHGIQGRQITREELVEAKKQMAGFALSLKK